MFIVHPCDLSSPLFRYLFCHTSTCVWSHNTVSRVRAYPYIRDTPLICCGGDRNIYNNETFTHLEWKVKFEPPITPQNSTFYPDLQDYLYLLYNLYLNKMPSISKTN